MNWLDLLPLMRRLLPTLERIAPLLENTVSARLSTRGDAAAERLGSQVFSDLAAVTRNQDECRQTLQEQAQLLDALQQQVQQLRAAGDLQAARLLALEQQIASSDRRSRTLFLIALLMLGVILILLIAVYLYLRQHLR